jgi:quaternary ammonium compound-resistance protein SugE
MNWIILFIAGIFEITWVISMKFSDGFTRLVPSLFTVVFAVLSMGLLSVSLKTLPVGTAYAIWTGIGATGTALLGIILFDESKDFMRIFFMLLIFIGLVGLRFYNK